jgi:transposase
MNYTYNQISKDYGVSKSALQHRVHRLKLKGRTLGDDGTIYFSHKQVEKIIDCYRISSVNHLRNIYVIELYQQGRNGRAIASILKMSTKTTYDCIKEYNKTGCITIESKLNKIVS